MRQPVRTRAVRPPKPVRPAAPNSLRDRLAVLVAVATVVCMGLVFVLARDTQFLMPGPLASAHGTIEHCNACHSKSGSGKLSWVRGLVAGDQLADSQACLTCHKMPDTAFNAHSASAKVLERSTRRLTPLAATTPAPPSARAQSAIFPTDNKVAHGLYCASCHQEHQGANFTLNKISNEQCRSCHVVKFDSFDGHHPEFEDYPFRQRTRIIYDHAGHFGKHFPEMAKKDPARRIPATCSTCHSSREDKRLMAVAPFEQTCTGCHLDQIVGKERVSGPKGVAFLTLPGLDLQTLKKRKASIGEWPEASEAELTPFMKMMISRNERGRALLKTVDRLNLQDLGRANDAQIRAVTNLAWEIKQLFYALIKGRASDVLADLHIGGNTKVSANLLADLTATLPRDVLVGAQQQWLPNLAAEMTNRPVAGSPPQLQSGPDARQASPKNSLQPAAGDFPQAKAAAEKSDAARADADNAKSSGSARADSGDDGEAPEKPARSAARPETPGGGPEAGSSQGAGKGRVDPQACVVAFFGQCLVSKGSDAANRRPDNGKEKPSADALPPALRAGLKELAQAAQPEGTENAKPAQPGKKIAATDEQPRPRAADQTDDLLNLTEEEQRGLGSPARGSGKAGQPEGTAGKPAAPEPADSAAAKADPRAPARAPAGSDATLTKPPRAAPAMSIESDVDAESWAEYGGWYRQDYAIFYRPTGHKDKFIHSWLVLTGPQAPKGHRSPATAVFDLLAGKDAPGSCTKCHSVDDVHGSGRRVNFSPPSIESKQGRFTNFIHEPHFGVLDKRGCLTCHSLEDSRPYLQSYEQGDPRTFVSNFSAVKKDLCQTCHTASMARQDCLLCHKYHVNGAITPIMSTKIPTK